MASRGPDNVTLKFIERFPGNNLMKGLIFPLALEAAEAYAVVIGRQRIRLKNPVAGAIPWYLRHDFTLDKRMGSA